MSPRLERWVWLVIALLAFLGGSQWARGRARLNLQAHADSLARIDAARDAAARRVVQLEEYARAQRGIAERATRVADSLTGAAERHRARVRVVDPTHVLVTSSDSQPVADYREVPIQVTEQLAIDSAALAAQDARGAADSTLLAVRLMEIGVLRTTVHLDTLAIGHLRSEVAELTALKAPRLTFREGLVAGLSLAAVVKLVVTVLVR